MKENNLKTKFSRDIISIKRDLSLSLPKL